MTPDAAVVELGADCTLRFHADDADADADDQNAKNSKPAMHAQIWTRVWSAGFVLARVLLRFSGDAITGSALELGAGLGLVSLALAYGHRTRRQSSKSRVVATDAAEVAVRRLHRNAIANGLVVDARQWNWNAPLPPEFVGRFDWVLGADVLYMGASVRPVCRAIRGALRADGGRALIVDPGRCYFEEFLDACAGELLAQFIAKCS